MQLRKYRWSRHYESAEEELQALLRSKRITAERWTADAGQQFAPHRHPRDKQLWCAEGSIIFNVAGNDISLQPGDALDLPADTLHSAVAGLTGAVCYESPPMAENPSILPHSGMV